MCHRQTVKCFLLANMGTYLESIKFLYLFMMIFCKFECIQLFYIILIFHFSLFLLPRGVSEEFWQLTISYMICDGSFCLIFLYSMFWPWKSPATTHFSPTDLQTCMNNSWVNCDFQVVKCSEKDNYWKVEVMV